MLRWILSLALLAACSPDVGDECATDADCAALGDDLFCFDHLCVDDPPNRGLDEPEPDLPPAAEPQFVGCGAVRTGQMTIEATGVDRWRMSGSTGESRLISADCGGVGDDGVFRIRFETPGVYTLATDPSTAFVATLSTRAACADATSETSCGAGDLTTPSLTLFETRAADEAVQVLVDAQGAGGPFVLSAIRADAFLPPAIDAATVWTAAEQATVRVTGEDANGDAEALELTWLDGEGVPIGEPIDLALTPSPRGKVTFTALSVVRRPVPDGAASARLRLRDSRGEDGPVLEVERRPLTELAIDTPCEPGSAAERCAPGLVCPAVDAPTCRPPTPPRAISHRASIDATTGIFEIVVEATDRDWIRVDWQPVSAGGEPLAERATLPLHETATTDAEQTVHARVALDEAARRYQLWTVGASGAEDSVEGVFDMPPQGRFGDACEPSGLTTQCEPGTWCRVSFGQCWPVSAPAIQTLDAWFNAEQGTFGVRVEARDAAGIVGIELDAGPQGDAGLLLFHRVSQAGTRTTGWGAWPLAAAPSAVRIRNQDGHSTESIAISPGAPPQAPPGGGCDPLQALAICPGGQACVSPDDDGLYSCQ